MKKNKHLGSNIVKRIEVFVFLSYYRLLFA